MTSDEGFGDEGFGDEGFGMEEFGMQKHPSWLATRRNEETESATASEKCLQSEKAEKLLSPDQDAQK
jgi:hypothetical protein